MADIYLSHEKNKQKYIECYHEISEKLPGPPTAHLLGDALISVHEVTLILNADTDTDS